MLLYSPGTLADGVRGALRRSPAADAAAPPIDLVVLWVNGSDPAHAAARAQFAGAAGIITDAAAPQRWADHGELRYLLRSVERYAPWVRHIYIVTSLGQRPAWLSHARGRVTVVSDADLLPKSARPTFNNYAVELYLHRIPGLSRVFIKMDDDMLFGRRVYPHDFYAPGQGVVVQLENEAEASARPCQAQGCHENGQWAAARRGNQMISEVLGARKRALLLHSPHALDRDVLLAMERRWPEYWEACAAERFRGPKSIDLAFAASHLMLESRAGGGLRLAPFVARPSLEQLFNQELDANGDGYLSLGELRVVAFASGHPDLRMELRDHAMRHSKWTAPDLMRVPGVEQALLRFYGDGFTLGMNANARALAVAPRVQRTTNKRVTLKDDVDSARRDLGSLVRIRRAFVTVNDGGATAPEVLRLWREFYEALFPEPSVYEVDGDARGWF